MFLHLDGSAFLSVFFFFIIEEFWKEVYSVLFFFLIPEAVKLWRILSYWSNFQYKIKEIYFVVFPSSELKLEGEIRRTGSVSCCF